VSSESSKPSVTEGPSDSRSVSGAALGAQERAALLQACWALIEGGLLGRTAAIFQEVQLGLARSGKEELVRLGRELALQAGPVAQSYVMALRAANQRAVEALLRADAPAPAPSAAPPLGLSLLAIEQDDIGAQVEQAAARLRNLVQEPWTELAGRLPALGMSAQPEERLPLAPALFVQAAAQGLGLGAEASSALVRSLPAALAPELGAAYRAILQRLQAAGVQAPSVARAVPVLRPSGAAAGQRPLAPPLRPEPQGGAQTPLMSIDMEATPARPAAARKSGAGRAVAPVEHEAPELQPDTWGLREYVRLQALFGINAAVLLECALQGPPDGPVGAESAREAPARALVSALVAAQKIDAAHVARLVRRPAGPPPGAPSAASPAGGSAGAPGEPIATREYSRRLFALAGLPLHQQIVHLVSRIFARIERDGIVPEAVRAQLVALRFPFLEVALADASVLVRPDHPARLLINAIASAAVAGAADAPGAGRYRQPVAAAVQYVLGAPGAATGAFAQAQAQFGEFLAEQARAAAGPELERATEALRAAEERETRALEVGAFLGELLAGAPLDALLQAFLLRDWARVLVEAADAEAAQPGLLQRMLSVVPDLVWSVQPMVAAQERKRLAEVVPTILERLREGLKRIGWSSARFKELAEHLRQVHAGAPGDARAAAPAGGFSVSTLRIRLDGFRMQDLSGTPRLKPFVVVEGAVRRYLDARSSGVNHRRISADQATTPPVLERAQAEALIDRWRPGLLFELRLDRNAQRVRLEGFSPARSLALFASAGQAPRMSLSHQSLVTCLCRGWLAPVEPVPLLARAFRSVLSDLKRSAQAAAEGGTLA
jgi:hypothetical protein